MYICTMYVQGLREMLFIKVHNITDVCICISYIRYIPINFVWYVTRSSSQSE